MLVNVFMYADGKLYVSPYGSKADGTGCGYGTRLGSGCGDYGAGDGRGSGLFYGRHDGSGIGYSRSVGNDMGGGRGRGSIYF